MRTFVVITCLVIQVRVFQDGSLSSNAPLKDFSIPGTILFVICLFAAMLQDLQDLGIQR